MSHPPRVCPAPRCGVVIPRNLFACRRHWFRLPAPLRRRINDAWKAGRWKALREAQDEARDYFRRFLDGPERDPARPL